MNTQIRDLKLSYTTDQFGNNHTGATYLDQDGHRRASHINGHVNEATMVASIQRAQRFIKQQMESGSYYT